MTEWCHEFDFSTGSTYGWTIVERGTPTSQGFETTCSEGVAFPGATYTGVDIKYIFDNTVVLTSMSMIFDVTSLGENSGLLEAYLAIGSAAGTGNPNRVASAHPLSIGNNQILVWTGNQDTSHLEMGVYVGHHNTALRCPDPLGNAIIKGITLRGTNTNPFVPNYSLITDTQVPDQTAFIYLAPITGNPSETNLIVDNSTRPIVIDSYAIDPITQHLWLHAAQGWLKATASDYTSGTILKPDGCYWTQDDTYTGTDRIKVEGTTLGNLSLPLQEILNCISNEVANASYELPTLTEVPWELSSTQIEQLFTHFPKSLEQICASTRTSMYGVGCDTGASYDPPGEHAGFDVFGPVDSNVYSMRDDGIVVGIGVGLTSGAYQQRSCSRWGASDVTENTDDKGYSVIVRHGHLYVLYGHIKLLSSDLYVGKKVSAGTLLGQTGTSTNLGAVPHVHIEMRSFGVNVPTGLAPNDKDSFVKDQNDGNNGYGILANGGKPALNIYEAAQFFARSVTALISDSSTSTSVAVTGLGKAIANGDKVTFDTTPPSSCGLPTSEDDKPQLEYCCGAIGTDVEETEDGYRGFQLSQQNVIAPEVEPTDITTIP